MMKISVMLVAVVFGLVCSRSVPDNDKWSADGICKGYYKKCTTSAECCHEYYCSSPSSNSIAMCIPTPPVLGCAGRYEICHADSECCPNYECKQYCRPEGPNCAKKDKCACKSDPMFRTKCPRKCGKCPHKCVKKIWHVFV